MFTQEVFVSLHSRLRVGSDTERSYFVTTQDSFMLILGMSLSQVSRGRKQRSE